MQFGDTADYKSALRVVAGSIASDENRLREEQSGAATEDVSSPQGTQLEN